MDPKMAEWIKRDRESGDWLKRQQENLAALEKYGHGAYALAGMLRAAIARAQSSQVTR